MMPVSKIHGGFVDCYESIIPNNLVEDVFLCCRNNFTALQNFGIWANSFEHGPLYLHGKLCSSFFNVYFGNGTPEARTVLLHL